MNFAKNHSGFQESGFPETSTSYCNYKAQIEKNVPHYRTIGGREEIVGFSGVELFVIHPPRPFLSGTGADTNNNSLILKLVYKEVSFIFCGDIQKQAIGHILAYGPFLRSSVIKVPHHGSDEGKQEENLFRAVSAQVGVISVDKDNRFGFPAPAVLKRLEDEGVQVYKTSDCGAITISTNGQDIWVKTMVE